MAKGSRALIAARSENAEIKASLGALQKDNIRVVAERDAARRDANDLGAENARLRDNLHRERRALDAILNSIDAGKPRPIVADGARR